MQTSPTDPEYVRLYNDRTVKAQNALLTLRTLYKSVLYRQAKALDSNNEKHKQPIRRLEEDALQCSSADTTKQHMLGRHKDEWNKHMCKVNRFITLESF